MGVSPFFATCGYDLVIAVHPDAEFADLRACNFAINFHKNHKFLRDLMKDAQAAITQYTNRDHVEPPPFCVGDCVYVRTDHIRTNRTAHKLAEKKIGPFPIISQPSATSFTLRLPSTIQIHPVFHVAQLEPKHPNTFNDHEQPPPLPLIINSAPEYLIEWILDSKYNWVRRKCHLLYHIKWVGYSVLNNSSDWILANAFDNAARKLIADAYHKQHPTKPEPKHLMKDWE